MSTPCIGSLRIGWRRVALLLVALSLLLPTAVPAQDKAARNPAASAKSTQQAASASRFIRLVRDARRQPTRLQTAIVRYVPADDTRPGLVIDLVGVMHVGEKAYYQQLNRVLGSYDVLLYELVAPEGTRVPQGGSDRADHPVAALQRGLKSMLELEYQLEHIDYSRKNFVHADMSPAELAHSMKARDESVLQMMFRMMGASMAQQSSPQNQGNDAKLLLALFSKDRVVRLRQLMAQQLADVDGALVALDGPDGSTLITERNKKALAVLTRQITAGHRRIGIFYGAGHMPDLEQRLLKDFRMKRGEQRWLTAWELTARATPGAGKK